MAEISTLQDQNEAVPDILSGIKNKLNPYCRDWIKLESLTNPAHKLLLEQTYQFKYKTTK